MNNLKKLTSRLTVCFTVFLCAGCAVSERIVIEDREGEIPRHVLDALKKSETTREWIDKTLGEPEYYERKDPKVEVMTYAFSKSHFKQANALLVFKFKTVERHKEFLHVVMKDNTIRKHWIDEFEHIRPHKINNILKESQKEQDKEKRKQEKAEKKAAKKQKKIEDQQSKEAVTNAENTPDGGVAKSEKSETSALKESDENFGVSESETNETLSPDPDLEATI